MIYSLGCLWLIKVYNISCFAYYGRKLEDTLDAFADRVSKPRLYLTDKMQIALGKLYKILRFVTFVVIIYQEEGGGGGGGGGGWWASTFKNFVIEFIG